MSITLEVINPMYKFLCLTLSIAKHGAIMDVFLDAIGSLDFGYESY